MKIFKNMFTRQNNYRKDLMQHFSQEYLTQLVNEHRLLGAAINHLQVPGIASQKVRQHGQDPYALAITNLRAERVAIEAKIDMLNEFLNG